MIKLTRKKKDEESIAETNEAVETEEVVEENETEESLEQTLQEDLDKMEDQFLRAQAEIANMRNRHKKSVRKLLDIGHKN